MTEVTSTRNHSGYRKSIKSNFRALNTTPSMATRANNLKDYLTKASSHITNAQDVNCVVIAFDKDYFSRHVQRDKERAEALSCKTEKGENILASKSFLVITPRIHALILSILTTEPSPMSDPFTQSSIFELIAEEINQGLYHDVEEKSKNDPSIEDKHKLDDVKKFIEQHFLEELTLTSLCRQAALNEFKLKKGFKLQFGTSVMQYVRKLRMDYAQSLLRDFEMKVEEVASVLGYHYPNHFSAAYKKYFGILPSQR